MDSPSEACRQKCPTILGYREHLQGVEERRRAEYETAVSIMAAGVKADGSQTAPTEPTDIDSWIKRRARRPAQEIERQIDSSLRQSQELIFRLLDQKEACLLELADLTIANCPTGPAAIELAENVTHTVCSSQLQS